LPVAVPRGQNKQEKIKEEANKGGKLKGKKKKLEGNFLLKP